MILVTGATGHVGRELVGQLLDRAQRVDGEAVPIFARAVRAMTRRPETARLPPAAQVVYGDAEAPASLAAAFAGIDAAFLMSAQPAGSTPHPSHDLALATAARRAGVRHVVKLSTLDGGRSDDVLGAWQQEADAAVTAAGYAWTLLHPGRFASNTLQWAAMIRQGDIVTVPFATRPAAPIDPADIAAVAVAAFLSDRHHQARYPLSGPQILTPADELTILGRTLSRPLRISEPPIGVTRELMARYGMPEPVVDAIITRVHADDRAEVLPTVSDILGRAPRTFAQWAEAHAGAFVDDPSPAPRPEDHQHGGVPAGEE